MPLKANQSLISAEVRWSYEADNTGFSDATQSDTLSFRVLPDQNELWAFEFTINPAADTTIDLYDPYQTLVRESTFPVSIRGGWITVSGSGGILRMEPGASDPLNWPIPAGGYEILTPGSGGAGAVWSDGEVTEISTTARNWKFSNTGAAQITVKVVLFVDGAVFQLDFSRPHNSGYLVLL